MATLQRLHTRLVKEVAISPLTQGTDYCVCERCPVLPVVPALPVVAARAVLTFRLLNPGRLTC